MMTFASESCGPVGLEQLETLSGPKLAALYRELTGSAIKKFESLKIGVERVRPALEKAITPKPPRCRKPFLYPVRDNGMPVRGAKRAGSKRSTLIEILQRPGGATFEEAGPLSGFTTYKGLYEQIYLLHSDLGYGLMEDEHGRISLFTDPAINERIEDARNSGGDFTFRSHHGAGLQGRRRPDHEGRDGAVAGGKERERTFGGSSGPVGRDLAGRGDRWPEHLPGDLQAKASCEDYRMRGSKDSAVQVVLNPDRLEYLRKLLGEDDCTRVAQRALRFFDEAVCARVVEGARLVSVGRNGRSDEVEL